MEREMSSLQLFGCRLAEKRRDRHLTQEDMANRLGVTPQALSKWERGVSSPDIMMLASICSVLEVSSEYLLGIGTHRITEDGNEKIQNEIWRNLREGLEPLELIFGTEIVPAFQDNRFVEKVADIRVNLSKEGILMPIIHIKDMVCMKPKEFMILSYQNVLHDETIETVGEDAVAYILERLEETVREKYSEILNVDLMKNLVDNLKIKYPALIEGVVPEKISYGLLTETVKGFLNRGRSMIYLPRIIEIMENKLRENSLISVTELTDCVVREIGRPNNFHVIMGTLTS